MIYVQSTPYTQLHHKRNHPHCPNHTKYNNRLTLALTAAADSAAAAATVTSLSVFLAVLDSSDDVDLSPVD